MWAAAIKLILAQRTINELKLSQKGFSQDSKEKKKAEKLAALMGNFQGVSRSPLESSDGAHG